MSTLADPDGRVNGEHRHGRTAGRPLLTLGHPQHFSLIQSHQLLPNTMLCNEQAEDEDSLN